MHDNRSEYLEESANSQAFHEALDTLSGPLFAVLDGAHFDDLEDEMSDMGIKVRSLFLEAGDSQARQDGPWFIKLEDAKTRHKVEQLALEKPCAVFWSCDAGGDVLWRHLRTINEILVPDDRSEINDTSSHVKYERVLFRHWDPNVIGSFLSKLMPQHLARVFGPANGIIANATHYGGFKRALRPKNLPAPAKGPLHLDPTTIRLIQSSRDDYRSENISRYLRSVAPERTSPLSDEELHALSRKYINEARAHGISSEASTGRWCYMQMMSRGQFGSTPEVRALMLDKNNAFTPDDRISHLMTIVSMKLREGR